MNNFPVGTASALALCLVFFAWLAWYARCARRIGARLQTAMALTFVAIPLIGLAFVVIKACTR